MPQFIHQICSHRYRMTDLNKPAEDPLGRREVRLSDLLASAPQRIDLSCKTAWISRRLSRMQWTFTVFPSIEKNTRYGL